MAEETPVEETLTEAPVVVTPCLCEACRATATREFATAAPLPRYLEANLTEGGQRALDSILRSRR